MKSRSLAFVLIVGSISVAAQVMNVRKWRQTERDSLDHALIYAEDNSFAQAAPIFAALLQQHPDEDFLKYSFGKSALFVPEFHATAYEQLSAVYKKNRRIPDIQYDLAAAAHYAYKLDEAEHLVTSYMGNRKSRGEGRKKAAALKRYIVNARRYYNMPSAARLTPVGAAVNTPGDDYAPAMNLDGSLLAWTYSGEHVKGGGRVVPLESDSAKIFPPDVYISTRQGEFTRGEPVDSVNTADGEAVTSMSPDGRVLFIYRNVDDGHGDLYQSYRGYDGYTRPAKMKGLVNSWSNDAHCALSPDGRTLYFSSERSGGKGGLDLYRATLDADSNWVNAVNLGDSINSPGDEDAPFMHADGRTLYFSSNGPRSMGGYDLFRSVLAEGDSLFTDVENLGYPVNTPEDERHITVAASGAFAYMSTFRQGGEGLRDIYKVERFGGTPALCVLRGKITRLPGAGTTTVTVARVSGETAEVRRTYDDPVSHHYMLALAGGADYVVTYQLKDMPRKTFSLSLRQLKDYTERTHDVTFGPVKDTAAAPIVVKNSVKGKKATATTTVAAGTPTRTASVPTVVTESFKPNNAMQAQAMRFVSTNGETAATGLTFMVQVAAVKSANKYIALDAKRLGRVEKMQLGDGLTRITVGGGFKTLAKAFEHNKRVVRAGQTDAFVIAIFDGRRVTFEELVERGVFK